MLREARIMFQLLTSPDEGLWGGSEAIMLQMHTREMLLHIRRRKYRQDG